MKTLIKGLLLGLLCSSQVMAGDVDRQEFHYDGTQNNWALDLLTQTYRTAYRTVRTPYTDRVCHWETRYRQQCSYRPGRRVCRTQYRNVCRTRRVCRRDRRGRQICRTQRRCRQVPRQVCTTRPGRRVCRQVPYQHQVCRNVTRYRTRQVPYQVLDQETRANVGYRVINPLNDGRLVSVRFEALLQGSILGLQAYDQSNAPVIVRVQDNRDVQTNGAYTTITHKQDVSLTRASKFLEALESLELENVDLREGELTGTLLPRQDLKRLVARLELKIGNKVVLKELKLANYLQTDDEVWKLSIDLNELTNARAGDSVEGQLVIGFKLPKDTVNRSQIEKHFKKFAVQGEI